MLAVPAPGVMPLDRDAWAGRLDLSNFVNTYCQYRDLQLCPGSRRVLIVGPGQGLDTEVLRWRGYTVTTFDIDQTFRPDAIGSVHDLSMFADHSFDAVIASHVLEHLATPYLDTSLAEIARVGRYALVYLPVAGRHFQFGLRWDLKGIEVNWILDLYNYFHTPDGVTPRYCQAQHYWELGMKGFRRADLLKRMAPYFDVIRHYRNHHWNPSYNFILRSRLSP